MGIDLVTYLAGLIASAPGASLPVKAFAPWAILFLTLAVLSLVLWRTWAWRALAIPLVFIGLMGATGGAPFDLAVPATGESAALRLSSGQLAVMGQRPGAFAAEQWLRADGDPRLSSDAKSGVAACDDSGCVAKAFNGRFVALITERSAFLEDCARAAIVVTPLYAPAGCAAPIVIDRRKLTETGAVALRFKGDGVEWTTARAIDEDRPWSPAPRERRKSEFAPVSEEERNEEDTRAMEPLE